VTLVEYNFIRVRQANDRGLLKQGFSEDELHVFQGVLYGLKTITTQLRLTSFFVVSVAIVYNSFQGKTFFDKSLFNKLNEKFLISPTLLGEKAGAILNNIPQKGLKIISITFVFILPGFVLGDFFNKATYSIFFAKNPLFGKNTVSVLLAVGFLFASYSSSFWLRVSDEQKELIAPSEFVLAGPKSIFFQIRFYGGKILGTVKWLGKKITSKINKN